MTSVAAGCKSNLRPKTNLSKNDAQTLKKFFTSILHCLFMHLQMVIITMFGVVFVVVVAETWRLGSLEKGFPSKH